MCGRYGRRADKQRIAEWFHTHNTDVFNDEYYEINSTPLAPSYNISPESIQPVVRLNRDAGERDLALMKWGLVPYWSKTPKASFSSINARSDKLESSGAWREPWKHRRCLIPANFFFEWEPLTKEEEKMRLSKPWAVSLADDRPFAFGGIWDRWKGEDKDKNEIIVESFSIITTDPNEVLEPFHNRCPLIIEPKDYEPWLAPAEPSHLPIDLVRTYPTSTSARSLFPVAPPVNGLDVFRMVVPPRSSHATGIDVVGDNVGVVGELFIADTAFAFLGHNLLVQQLSHFRIRAYLPITARMLEVVNATDSQLALTPFSRDRFPAAAELRTVNRAKLVSTEFHGFLQFVFGVSAGSDEWWRCFALIQVSRQKRGNRIKFPCADPPWLGAVGVKSGYATAWRSGPLTPTSVTSESSPNTRGIYNRPKSPTKADPEFFYSVHLATENNC